MDLKDTYEVLVAVSKAYGPYLATLMFITLLVIVVILFFFKNRIEKISEEISTKTIKRFETKLELSLRDEVTRKELVLHQGIKSIEKQLEMYDLVYKLYFHYQKIWEWSKDVNKYDNEIQELWNDILETRRTLFLNSIYISGELIDYLLTSVITMWNLVEQRCAENNYPSIYKKYNNQEMNTFKKESQLGDYLNKAEKYIRENFYTSQNIKQYDYTEEQKKLLESEKISLFNENT